VLLGAIAAWVGVVIWQQNLIPIQRPLFALTSLILIVMGVRLLRQSSKSPLMMGMWLGARIASYWAKYLGRFAGRSSRWFSGMLWGLVPCGLVYSVLPLAFLSGDVVTGAALMLAFGLGTLPNLLLISKFSAVLTQFGQYIWVRYIAAGLLLSAGIFGLYRAWYLSEALLKGGFCIA
jgi:sulfite exporter TauE/SafE